MTHRTIRLAFLVCAFGLSAPALALNVLVSNDDGLTANVIALRAALIDAGHEVVMSIPCQNQSGKGASLDFFSPIAPLTKACVGGAASVGAPGVGAIEGIDDAYYVDGTPIMATMHGIDIVALKRWEDGPDLIISGPNEGQNAGGIAISSGTVSNAQFALHRGLPAIAVSADSDTRNPALAKEVATLTVKLVAALEKRSTRNGLLPRGIGLNVNYPKFAVGESSKLQWVVTRFGNFDYVTTRFVMDLSKDSRAAALRLEDVQQPGVTTISHTVQDASKDADRLSEALVMLAGKIAVTPMQFGYEAPQTARLRVARHVVKTLNERSFDRSRKNRRSEQIETPTATN